MGVRTDMEGVKDLVSLGFLLHKWKGVVAMKRKAWQPNEHSRICGDHFIPSTFALLRVDKF